MTKLPHPSRQVIDRPDLPEYELNQACPVTGEVNGLENHHLWRRSFGTKSWWVELPDGTVVGNRINLSPQAHYRITVNKAAIVLGDDGVFYWDEAGEQVPLRWQPPGINTRGLDPMVAAEIEADFFAGKGPLPPPQEGEECPSCHRRVPHKKKESSPKTKVFSTRVPVDDIESFNELVDTLAQHLGVYEKPHSRFWAIHYAAAAALQDESLKGALS